MSKSKDKSFKFFVPVDLVKSKDKDDLGEWKIKGIASTPDEDLQGELVDQDGLDISLLKAGRGLLNWDHQKGPENVLGQIEDANFIKGTNGKNLEIEGYLFKNQERAKSVYNIMNSVKKANGSRIHMSIEGKILQRDLYNPKSIRKARIDKVALTLDPVNPHTYADLVKSLNTPEEDVEMETKNDTVELNKATLEQLIDVAQKALAVGTGYTKAPSARSGGEAMSTEALDKDEKKVTYDKDKKDDKKKDMLKSLFESLCETHPDHDPMELAGWVIEAFKIRTNKGE